jgi:Ser/Thr protein kinase RdoA (MazF antagonist)
MAGWMTQLIPNDKPIVAYSPSFTAAGARKLASDRYGRAGMARELTSERDQNFLIEPSDGGSAIVLKIANAREERALLEAQQQVLTVLGQRRVATPRVVCTTSGEA